LGFVQEKKASNALESLKALVHPHAKVKRDGKIQKVEIISIVPGDIVILELGDKKIVRVNIIGNIVDRYESLGETRYISMTVDDGSGQIKMKAFGDDTDKLKGVTHGQTVLVIGSLRHFNDEVYISPEIVREQNPKYLLLRKMEVESKPQAKFNNTPSNYTNNAVVQKSPSAIDVRAKVLEMIKSSESGGGIETEALLKGISQPSDVVNEEVKKLLEEGMIFEPRPGKVRWLG